MVKLIVSLFVIGCAANAAPSSTSTHSMKGWELYSWSSGCTNADATCFALLVGTNRMKSVDEIKQTPLTLQQLDAALAKLATGDEILWRAPTSEFTLPDPMQPTTDPLRRAEATIQRLGLKLTVAR
jgi:hypothetical protein